MKRMYSMQTALIAISIGIAMSIANLAGGISVSNPDDQAQPPPSGSAALEAQPTQNSRMAQGAESASALSAQDRQFIDKAGAGGLAEVQEAGLAREKAASADVKRAADELKKDHDAANAELKRIAASYGVELPKEPTQDRKELLEKLRKLSGAEFDREYMRAGIAAHENTVALFEKTAKDTRNSDMRRFAMNTLPTLKKHLNMMKELSGKQA
jgi:putative membrane protein